MSNENEAEVEVPFNIAPPRLESEGAQMITDPALELLLEVQRRLARRSQSPWVLLYHLQYMDNHRLNTLSGYYSDAKALMDEAFESLFPNHIGPLSTDQRLQVVARAIRFRRERYRGQLRPSAKADLHAERK